MVAWWWWTSGQVGKEVWNENGPLKHRADHSSMECSGNYTFASAPWPTGPPALRAFTHAAASSK